MLGKLLGAAILLAFFAGWILVLGSLYDLWMLREVQDWPSRRGVITHSYVNYPRVFQMRRSVNVEIAGIYAGTNEVFGASRVGFGIEQSVWTRGRAAAFVSRYPVKSEHDVFHEPGNPRRAILVRSNSARPTLIAFGIGLVAGLLPFCLYAYGRRTGFGDRR